MENGEIDSVRRNLIGRWCCRRAQTTTCRTPLAAGDLATRPAAPNRHRAAALANFAQLGTLPCARAQLQKQCWRLVTVTEARSHTVHALGASIVSPPAI